MSMRKIYKLAVIRKLRSNVSQKMPTACTHRALHFLLCAHRNNSSFSPSEIMTPTLLPFL